MILHMETFHESCRLLLYAPFWIVNHTNLKLEFRVGIFLVDNYVLILMFRSVMRKCLLKIPTKHF
jgi:hypothetical protein